MSIVGFDDMSWYPLMTPPITVIKQPLHELGHLAIDLLLRRIKDDRGDFPLEISLQLQLIVRGSTSVPRST
jgi:LacI family transcriptional regulator